MSNDRTASMFLEFSEQRLRHNASRIVDCLGRLTNEQVWFRGSENENSIGNLVLHLCGNVRQWIISSITGEPDLRDRPAEFAVSGTLSAQELSDRLAATIEEALKALQTLAPERLPEMITVQKQQKAVLQAIYTSVEHFSHHTGQIIFATKMLTHADLGYFKHLNQPAPARG